MYTSVFLLGPDQWDDDFEVEAPTWLLTELKDLGEQGYQPKHMRTYLKRIIERDPSRRAVVMDPSGQKPGERDGDFFHRLEIENEVDSYVITVPSNTKVLGTVFEGGMLERDFHYGANPRILLFLQSTYAGRDHHDKIEFVEQGKRTRYLESLADRAHHVGLWEEPEDLMELVLEWIEME